MKSRSAGVASLERLEALVANPALYEMARLVPGQDPSSGGRRRLHPVFVWLLYDTLLSVYGSARQVEVELAHPLVWRHLQSLIRHRFPDDQELWLPEAPPPLPLCAHATPDRSGDPRRAASVACRA
jgi:hypothetical protein